VIRVKKTVDKGTHYYDVERGELVSPPEEKVIADMKLKPYLELMADTLDSMAAYLRALTSKMAEGG